MCGSLYLIRYRWFPIFSFTFCFCFGFSYCCSRRRRRRCCHSVCACTMLSIYTQVVFIYLSFLPQNMNSLFVVAVCCTVQILLLLLLSIVLQQLLTVFYIGGHTSQYLACCRLCHRLLSNFEVPVDKIRQPNNLCKSTSFLGSDSLSPSLFLSFSHTHCDHLRNGSCISHQRKCQLLYAMHAQRVRFCVLEETSEFRFVCLVWAMMMSLVSIATSAAGTAMQNAHRIFCAAFIIGLLILTSKYTTTDYWEYFIEITSANIVDRQQRTLQKLGICMEMFSNQNCINIVFNEIQYLIVD